MTSASTRRKKKLDELPHNNCEFEEFIAVQEGKEGGQMSSLVSKLISMIALSTTLCFVHPLFCETLTRIASRI